MNRRERRALRPHEIAKADQTRAYAVAWSIEHGIAVVEEHSDTGRCEMCDRPATGRFLVMVRGITSDLPTCTAHEELARTCLHTVVRAFTQSSGIPAEVRASGDYDDDLSGGVA